MKTIFFTVFFTALAINGFSQKQTFDVVSFAVPKSWQQKQNDRSVQLLATDNKTGAYVMAIITKATPSAASANENFNNQWTSAIKNQIQLDGEPVMQPPSNGNGWEIITGGATYTDSAVKGNVVLLSATGGGQTVTVIIMTNTRQYEKELSAFLNSLELAAPSNNVTSSNANPSVNNPSPSSIVGLWTYYTSETSGYSGGLPQVTAGYSRREYLFYANGQYVFRAKNWSVYMKEILFVYETGTWKINGNQLTITPAGGKGEWWGKAAGGSTIGWGNRIKAADYKLEKTTYSFEFKYYSGTKETSLILSNSNRTERDGSSNSNNTVNSWGYSQRALDKSLIDNPPGTTISVNNKPAQAAGAESSSLAGRMWEGTSSEKFTGAGTMTGYNTGGFSTAQYKFNTDGTYRFVHVLASHYTDTKTLEYETGTWSVNGNQLTINPVNGQNEEWTKTGKTSNGNSDVINRAINDTWGKKLKTSSKKLEKYTYTFSIGKNGNNNALILQRNGRTEREGEGSTSYFNEIPPERSVKLPAGIK